MTEYFHRIHKTDSGNYVVSAADVWMPGSYESAEAAEYATGFPDAVLQRLQDEANRRAGGSGGTITMADLNALRGDK